MWLPTLRTQLLYQMMELFIPLGLGHNNEVSLPTPIPNLPKINMISCGGYYTVCVDDLFLDCEGNVYSVGQNFFGELGLAHKINQNILNKYQTYHPLKEYHVCFQVVI